MKLSRIHLASTTALGVLALVGFSNQANAGAFAFADLQVNNFEIQSVTGNTLGGAPNGVLTNGSNITVENFQDTFTNIATVNGVTNAASGLSPSQVCTTGAGSCNATILGSPFAFIPAPPISQGNFSQAANQLSGFPIAGLGGATPANAQTAAQTQLIGNATGNANSTIALNSGFNFSLNGAVGTHTVIDLSAAAIETLMAGLDATGKSAQASGAFSFTIQETVGGVTTTLFSWAPNGSGTGELCAAASPCLILADTNLNTTAVNDTTPNHTATNDNSGNIEAQISLPNSVELTFGINHQTQTLVTSVASVPEPGSVALFAAGLIGLGAFVRRRRSQG